ncbi:cutinase family protein [Herbiconiux sp. SYSU D00978]|uniref:cutinase family protein n=1 Tax=Herbiconiux sp. SYSU D00978 TaxID=2812562 RepID=UPI001A95D2BD|nr:cutinase family protein [Herbiconiux sp. SYSU D00978]
MATPMSRRLTTMSALSAILGVLFSLLVGVQPANAYRSFSMCDADVVLITLRGTAEDNAPTGTTMAGLQAVARADRQLSVWTRTVDYPAIAYSLGGTYFTSLRTGTDNLRETILDTIEECPLSEIALAGYSQGAQAIGDLLAGTNVEPLPDGVRERIIGVALLADPSYRTGEPWNASGDTTARSGWFVRAAGAFDSWTRNGSVGGQASIVRSWCLTGDRFCSSGTGFDADAIHGSYATVVSSEVWNFLRSWAVDDED